MENGLREYTLDVLGITTISIYSRLGEDEEQVKTRVVVPYLAMLSSPTLRQQILVEATLLSAWDQAVLARTSQARQALAPEIAAPASRQHGLSRRSDLGNGQNS